MMKAYFGFALFIGVVYAIGYYIDSRKNKDGDAPPKGGPLPPDKEQEHK